ncbi:tRNA lysidine(34) synthetase TilS [Oceanibacterium hippocampi]|uniref:tRNA(Ile)-lysidine synthase n=1 Tax=Oceanibacterium hippocampi TaxID=745714 RepID=A0A1Y5TUM2_9PROT|nr:tRNA lysidine(34) synthetase TilS [Oceanibacterium hippocampi]SLN73298.1 tRNA(Ile)-lysidine synthase [Oceanibacterium hippocampi]
MQAGEFADLMSPLGPFEPEPLLAVAVSGGPDSMALLILADRWARQRGGAAFALTVDHGLRAEAADEARTVARWCAAQGIAHRTLRWTAGPGRGNLQAQARRARYRLLARAARAEGALHLLVAHHRGDVAATAVMRHARRSGVEGLAALAPVASVHGLRLLRPLLDVDPARLRDFLRARGQAWIEDPSNRSEAFSRTWAEAALLGPAGAPLDEPLTALAGRAVVARAALYRAAALLIASSVTARPEGWLIVRPGALLSAPPPATLLTLRRLLQIVSGATYPSAAGQVEALLGGLADWPAFRGATIGGARLVPWRGRLMLCREAGRITDEIDCTAAAGDPVGGEKDDRERALRWDGRFRIAIPPGFATAPGERDQWTVRRLGRAGWAEARRGTDDRAARGLPAVVGQGLPGIWRAGRLVEVPVLPGFRATSGIRAIYMPEFGYAAENAAFCALLHRKLTLS